MQRTVPLVLFFIHMFIRSSLSHSFDVRRPPDISSPEAPKVFYATTYRFSVPCVASGTPVIKYSWFQVGRDTDITTDSSQPVYVDSYTGTLQLADFTEREEGTFICKASNEFNQGKIKAVSFSPPVTVYRSRADDFSDEEKTFTAKANSYQVLLCDKKGDIVGSTIGFDWYIGRDTKYVNKDNDRLFIDNEGNLHFTYVKTTDTNLVEGYRCGVSIEGLPLLRLSANKKFLKVIPEPDPQQIAPQLMYSNRPVKVKIYLSAKLECMFSGYDPQSQNLPLIMWYFDNGTQIQSTAKFGFAHENRVLTINRVSEDDEKIYKCEASNSAGTSKKEELFLNVTGPPIFVAGGSPSDISVPEGKDAVFNCNAKSIQSEQQPEEPIWYINGIRRGSHTDPNKYVVSDGDRKLTVKSVMKDTDILCVQCYVENSEGGIWGDGCLTVILPIKVIQQPVTPQEIMHGDVIDLAVTATTDPSMTLKQKWEHNGTVYDNLEQIPFVKQRAINTRELSDDQFEEVGGLYRVTLYHFHDSKSIDIDVVTKFKPVVTAPGKCVTSSLL
ncbi:neuronal-glial cell adhesion molecule-like isoform X1 [Physella acuta]|uniref:neuronal-glial cell adhesion molecule-like isoform X1 n=1 Tax=Physella acuta TaxID=109671 RepID=UPI0027DB0868|nr:neuronal-glial cell adhesion molecule-like isoform X1 [Physella acuta]